METTWQLASWPPCGKKTGVKIPFCALLNLYFKGFVIFFLLSYTYVPPLARLDCLYDPWRFLDMYIITALVFISSLSQEFLNRRKHLTREVSIVNAITPNLLQ